MGVILFALFFINMKGKNFINYLRETKQNLFYSLNDFRRILLPYRSSDEIVNEKAMRVVGLRRSGNHAIITWIRRHYDEYVWHLNNVRVKQNPYRILNQHYPKDKFEQEAKGNFSQKSCLIYSYENSALENVTDLSFERKHDYYLGKSKCRYDLLILRDPFNMIASMYAGIQKSEGAIKYMRIRSTPKTISELWLDYAKEFLGETSYLKNNKVIVSYNKWCLDQDYRKQISEQLGLEFSDAGFNVVKKTGGGSSFEGIELDGQASKMDVMNRWQRFVNDPEYRKFFNQEIYDYSEKIFGHIPETESLIDTIN